MIHYGKASTEKLRKKRKASKDFRTEKADISVFFRAIFHTLSNIVFREMEKRMVMGIS